MSDIAVIIPVLNEELTVEATVRDFARELPDARLVVIDNGSEDTTPTILATLDREIEQLLVLQEPRRGKGIAVRTAFNQIHADRYLMVDGDSTYLASDAHRLLKAQAATGADLVVGDRRADGTYDGQNDRRMHGFGNGLVVTLVNRLFGASVNDVMSGYRVMERRLVEEYPLLVDGFELETDMTMFVLDRRLRFVEVPISYLARPPGSESKLNTFKDGFLVVRTIWRLCRIYRPLLFFVGLSVVLATLAVLAGLPAIIEYVQTGLVQRLPLAVLAVGLGVLAALSSGVGLMLDSLRHQSLAESERRLRRSTARRSTS